MSLSGYYGASGNTVVICTGCHEGAKGMIGFLKEAGSGNAQASVSNTSMGMAEALQRMKELIMEKDEEIYVVHEMREMLSFVSGLGAAFRESIHTDILVNPGSGPAIHAHRAVLATRSEIFKKVLSSDECKAPATQDKISLPEMSHDELRCFLEFLYCGTIEPNCKLEKHARTLLQAADKYEIPYLKSYCEAKIFSSMAPSNALQFLVVAEICSNTEVRKRALSSIVKHREDVLRSEDYDAFAVKNPRLGVEITRALLP